MRTTIQATLVAASTLAGLALGNANGCAAPPRGDYGVEVMTTIHGVFISTDERQCREEDSGHYCVWNLGGYGDARGLAFYRGAAGHLHYTWRTSPVANHPHRRWVDEQHAESYADTADGKPHSPAWWAQCYIQFRRGVDRVHCPNGQWWSAR